MAKSERKEALMRIFVGIVSGIITYLWGYVNGAVSIFHWLYALILGRRSRAIAEFVEYWNTQTYRFSRYMSGVSNERPFPFTGISRISKFQ